MASFECGSDLAELRVHAYVVPQAAAAASVPVTRVAEIAFHPVSHGVEPVRELVALVILRDEMGPLPIAIQGQLDRGHELRDDRRRSQPQAADGGMFLFIRNTLSGSQRDLISVRRSKFLPYAAATRSPVSSSVRKFT